MKIEFLYKDDTYKNVIESIKESFKLEENSITYTPVVQAGLNIFSFQKLGENEDTAKLLDEIKMSVIKSLSVEKMFIITDEVSLYFSQRLYPQLANFERGLRKVLYIASMKSNDGDIIKQCKKIEDLEFAQIYQMLFSDSNYVTEAKKIVNSNTPAYSKYDILKRLSDISESTIWDKLFKGEYSYISEKFLDIKNGRNKVMHSRNITYSEFSGIKNNLNKSNKLLKEIELDLLDKNSSNNDSVNIIEEAIKHVSEAVAAMSANQFTTLFIEKFGELFVERAKDKIYMLEENTSAVIDSETKSVDNKSFKEEESNGET